MSQSLEEVKNRVRQSYLGKGGVHAVGMSQEKQAIRVYVSPEPEVGESDLLDLVRESAKPFSVIVVREARAKLS